jgi:AraC-like DNA-binding protein
MHIDRTALFRRVKAQYGQSPSELLREARLKRAFELLSSRVGNVTEVAYAVGFESMSSFARAFRQRFGVAPSTVGRERAA